MPNLAPARSLFVATTAFWFVCVRCLAADVPVVSDVEAQPLLVHAARLAAALDTLGVPLSEEAKAKIDEAVKAKDAAAIRLVQEAFDPLCLAFVHINPEARVKVEEGGADRRLMQHGWTQFLVKVHNEAGVTAPLRVVSPQALPVSDGFPTMRLIVGEKRPEPAPPEATRDRWLEIQMFDGRPLTPTLSGATLEYRIVQLYSRDAGERSAVIAFDVGQGSQDIGFRNDVTFTFRADAATEVTFRVIDDEGAPTTAAFFITDALGRVYPSQAKRLEPDFAFQPQVYRADGESVLLPPGDYSIRIERGPESLPETRQITVGSSPMTIHWQCKRWVDPSKRGWWSGDHHIHAAGCAHYSSPTEGVHPESMARHIQGEDLKVGANLTWGPCFDYQKQFFTGTIDKASKYPYLLRYDVEVSGFGSHQSGHLVLLGLTEQIYPGGDSKNHWPTLCLNTLRWAKKQGAVCGPAHSGWGLEVTGNELPNYEVPKFNSIGAMEYIVDVTHMVEGPDGELVPAVDFFSTVDTPYNWELNCWYHTLNAGYRTRISGETDFPCIYDDRVGLGRSYVKVDGELTFDKWREGIRQGRCYVGEGRSHLIDFKVDDVELGVGESELRIDAPRSVTVTADVAAYLPETANPKLGDYPDTGFKIWANNVRPMWHIERGRLGDSRDVKVELVVNGEKVAEQVITADGEMRSITFDDVRIEKSSWIALRVPYSSHTNPIWVIVDGKPVRPNRKSIEWCLKAVDQLWSQKERFIAADEMNDAIDAYNHARLAYRKRLKECED